jgi:hypothetical protein
MTRRDDETVGPGDMVEHAILSALIDLGKASTDDAHRLYSLPDEIHLGVWGGRVGGRRVGSFMPSIVRTLDVSARMVGKSTSLRLSTAMQQSESVIDWRHRRHAVN